MKGNDILELRNFSYCYGSIKAVREISFHVESGEIVTLIGGNGAGKTTTLRAISGLITGGASGEIIFEDENIISLPSYKITKKGIAQCLEGRQVFPMLTVAENLQMGAFLIHDTAQIVKDQNYVYSLFPQLHERREQRAGTLSGGEQQMLAVARGLMMHPKLLMLDEPSLGLAPIIVEEIFQIIKKINADGMTILLVEQNSSAALSIAHRGYVVETGGIILGDTADNLKNNEQVKKSYLGIN